MAVVLTLGQPGLLTTISAARAAAPRRVRCPTPVPIQGSVEIAA
jgi:hypothetical protein